MRRLAPCGDCRFRPWVADVADVWKANAATLVKQWSVGCIVKSSVSMTLSPEWVSLSDKRVESQTMNMVRLPDMKIRVLIVDDHQMVLDVLCQYLSTFDDMNVYTVNSFNDAKEFIRESDPFDVVLLDFNMPGMKGVASVKEVVQLCRGKPVAVITGNLSSGEVDGIMNSGASGIILKTRSIKSLAAAVRLISGGESYLPIEILLRSTSSVKEASDGNLSEKEIAVLMLLCKGKSNKDIAAELKLSVPTVKQRVLNIFRKLSVSNRTEAVNVAEKRLLVH